MINIGVPSPWRIFSWRATWEKFQKEHKSWVLKWIVRELPPSVQWRQHYIFVTPVLHWNTQHQYSTDLYPDPQLNWPSVQMRWDILCMSLFLIFWSDGQLLSLRISFHSLAPSLISPAVNLASLLFLMQILLSLLSPFFLHICFTMELSAAHNTILWQEDSCWA